MKRFTLRFRKSDEAIFLAIKNGEKKVETRAATIRYKNMAIGDTVNFICGDKKFSRRISRAKYFKGILDMLRVYNITDISTTRKTKEELLQKYYSFPGYEEKLKKFGIMALEFA